MKIVNKVFAYITFDHRLLVFDQVDFPDEAVQVPAGTRHENENPEVAVLREAWEETGLADLKMGAFLGETDFMWAGSDTVFRRRFYHLICEGSPGERWRHYEEHPSEGPAERILFELYWVDLPGGVPRLSSGHDAFLQQLLRRMNLAPAADSGSASAA